MTQLPQLIRNDNVGATWFWTHSVSAGPYDQYEVFNVVFSRNTDEVALNGGSTTATLYLEGISESIVNGMNKHSGRVIYPSPLATLAHVIADAHQAAQYDTFTDWAEEHRDTSLGYRDAIVDFEDWELHRARYRKITEWLADGDNLHLYVTAAQAYAAEH